MRVAPRELRTRGGRPFTVRGARSQEAGALLDHYVEVRGTDPDVHIEPEVRSSADDLREWVGRLTAAANGLFLVAEAGGGVQGVLSAQGGGGRTAHVATVGLSVKRAWRRQGLATALLQTCVAEARAAPALRRLHLRVFAPNEGALRLYERAGFTLEGRLLGHVHVGDRDEDVLLMGMDVSSPDG